MEPGSRAIDAASSAGPLAQATLADNGDPGIAALRERGAHRLDPSRFRYLEALERRAGVHQGALGRTLDRQLAQVVTAYGEQYAAAVRDIDQAIPVLIQHHPQAAPELRRLHADGDVRAVRRLAARLEAEPRSTPLADLVRHIDGLNAALGQIRPQPSGATQSDTAALAELKTVQRFRDTWTRLRVDDQLARSQEKVPENPGPLNSHLLVQRALRRMQELSPAYLGRFMAQVEALSWLDHAVLRGTALPGKVVPRTRDKRKGRGKAPADRP